MAYSLEELRDAGLPIAMSMLVLAAKQHKILTYGQIAQQISDSKKKIVSPRHIGFVAGELMNKIIDRFPHAPPINTLVVNKIDQLPGDGADWYIRRFTPNIKYKTLSKKRKRALVLPVHEAVYNFGSWESIATKLFPGQIRKSDLALKAGEQDGKLGRLGFGGPAESPEHRLLKMHVASNPKKFGAPKGCLFGKTELRLESCDEIDVWFTNEKEQLAVEVKSRRSSDLDLRRGLFQCVKYRAILQAQLSVTNSESSVRALLVSERKLPSKLATWAKKLRLEVRIIDPLKNQ